MTKKETDYLPLWEPLDKSKETPVKKELTKAEEAEKKRKQKQCKSPKELERFLWDEVFSESIFCTKNDICFALDYSVTESIVPVFKVYLHLPC